VVLTIYGQPPVDFGSFGAAVSMIKYPKDGTFAQIIAAGGDGDAKRECFFGPLLPGAIIVLQRILSRRSSVIEILRVTVADQNNVLDLRFTAVHFLHGVSYGGTHAGGAMGFNLPDPSFNLLSILFIKSFDGKKVYFFPPVSGKAENGVFVADLLQGFGHNH
jgi:hypothetical protein